MTTRPFAVFLLGALLAAGADAQDAAPPPRVAELVAKLADADAAARAKACDELAEIGAPAVPSVVTALADEKQRAGAFETLARMGPVAKAAAPALAAIIDDAASPVRADAIRVVGTLGAAGLPAYMPLSRVLADATIPTATLVDAAAAVRRIALRGAVPPKPKTAKAGTPDAAVQAGLDWLARHQAADGRWSCRDFGTRCEHPGECPGPGDESCDPGITGLAMKAFLVAGETQFEGPHAANVAQGLAYLRRIQQPDGSVGRRESRSFIYNHAIGAFALIDVYALTGAPALAEPSRRALAFTQAARNPDKAWRYDIPPKGDNDTSVTVWNAMVLDAAAGAGLEIDPAAMSGALTWIDEVTDPDTGRTGYQKKNTGSGRTQATSVKFPADKSEALTAAALVTRLCVGRTRETDPMIEKAESLLAARAPMWDPAGGGTDLYYWVHGVEALHRLGGPKWEAWRRALPTALVPNQLGGKGCARGSWNLNDPWCGDGGRIWMTSACLLALTPCLDDVAKRPTMPPGLRACADALAKAAKAKDVAVRIAASRALEAIHGAYR